ncbi:hypothetical protein EGI26_19365 [Lacihabitans sp. CCS-44]|uniref:hypothetical protein n=1 Tax=Lacihabitans sp. CCS-44 TaxID=2487331 RepID=UPI0020CBE977|nr:hypothetical protein [Lacihabitans sp. CCS-44]MCP9757326.1 hypothetical protein [Lacihabitans sp. CCS-44]
MFRIIYWLFLLALGGCATLQNHSKYQLSSGAYKLKVEGNKGNSYIYTENDTIKIFDLNSKTTKPIPPYSPTKPVSNLKIIKPSLDIDVLTALVKLRPAAKDIGVQMNGNINGNLYLGYRTDIYNISFKENPVYKYQRQVNHFGLSGGVFMGFGNSSINASTAPAQVLEYDGIVFQKGIAGIIAINKLTVGLSIGSDILLDKNKISWEYQNKPWYGLMLGLNLN